jgi:hypothetical protein
MKIYVASSWRCERQKDVVRALSAIGHDVYDFRNPAPGNVGFGWKQCGDHDLKDPRVFRDHVLTSPVAQSGFQLDMAALKDADATVLVLPCGRSAHLELGYATGAGQHTLVLLDDPMSEPELMYLMNGAICVTLQEVIEKLDACQIKPSHHEVAQRASEWADYVDTWSLGDKRRREIAPSTHLHNLYMAVRGRVKT